MFRLLFLLLLFGSAYNAYGQISVHVENPGIDTLHIVFHKDKWAIEHTVAEGENIFMLSHRYHVPPALLADMNEINFQTSLKENTILYIPFGPYNMAKAESANRFDVRPLYYIVREFDNLFRLAHLAGVQQKKLQEWNGMLDNYIKEGQRLFVGWVLYDMSKPKADTVLVNGNTAGKQNNDSKTGKLNTTGQKSGEQTVIILKKGKKKDTLPEIHRTYNAQTNNDSVVMEEKGTAVFYEDKGKLKGSDIYFAFHNTAKPGTIIKVYNPGTEKMIFVKVLGPIPNTKMYYNSVIGISDRAKEVLLVTEEKAWCELRFAPPN